MVTMAETGARARVFRAAVEGGKALSAGERVLLDEACRLIDRSDRYDALIRGDISVWASIEWPFEDAPGRLVISSVVAEARQTVTELRQVVKALDLSVEVAAPTKSRFDELAARRSG